MSQDTSVFEKPRKGEKEANLEEANDIGSFSHDAGDNTSTRT